MSTVQNGEKKRIPEEINLVIRSFSELTTRELYEILRVRAEVFVVEQNCVYQDLDEKDQESLHLFYEKEGRIQAYLRVFMRKEEEKLAQIGRVLTVARGTGLGTAILKDGLSAAKKYLGAEEVYIEAQCYATGYYEKAGFQITSEEFLEDGIPHVEMRVRL